MLHLLHSSLKHMTGLCDQLCSGKPRRPLYCQPDDFCGYQRERQAQRSPWLDVLKALAMLGVILIHFNNAWNSPIPIISKASAIGARCPQLFFIISAYLTWASLAKHDVQWKKFYKKRFIRIGPIFYTALIISTLIPMIKRESVGNWISHFLFLNGLVPVWTNSIMGVEWYIADLALFYMLVPLLRKMIRDLRSSLIAFVVTAFLSSISLIIYNAIGGSSVQAVQMYFETFFILHQLPVMILGIVLYYLIMKIDGKNVWKMLVGGGIGIALIGLAFIVLHLNKRFMTSTLIAGVVFAWLFLAFWLIRDVFEYRV